MDHRERSAHGGSATAVTSGKAAPQRPDLPLPACRLEVFLIRPSKYDDEGYVIRHLRSVLPSNTLATLHALTEDVRLRGQLKPVEMRSHLCDESVQAIPERQILRLSRRTGTKVLVGLVGAQTSQFPRAMDLARRLRTRGVNVIIGGFHVSGTLTVGPDVPSHLQALMDEGITLVKGEVEQIWPTILRDAAKGTLGPLYDAINDKPDLLHAPVPRLDSRLMKKFVYRHFGTVDTSRGCPFTCSFCTIINVQGRKMRFRDAGRIAAAIEENYRETGTHHYFFTDDNFGRAPNWRAILYELIRLREEMGVPVRFLMQVDALSHKIPDFIPLVKRAGCFQVFIGMESLNSDNLIDAGKRQNKVAEYASLIDAWHVAGILTHVGYIIGFPHDAPETVREHLQTLKHEIRPDLAAFFMLTPLPGSTDYQDLITTGTPIDDDLNRYDTWHPVIDHPCMSRETWFDLYQQAWREFYTFDHMRQQLARLSGDPHTTLLQLYLWYGTATRVENYHPMMTGVFRFKPRTDRRPGYAIDGRLRHLLRRLPEIRSTLAGYGAVLAELQQLWVETHQVATSVPRCQASFGVGDAAPTWRNRLRLWMGFLHAMFGPSAPPSEQQPTSANPLPPPATVIARRRGADLTPDGSY